MFYNEINQMIRYEARTRLKRSEELQTTEYDGEEEPPFDRRDEESRGGTEGSRRHQAFRRQAYCATISGDVGTCSTIK